MGFRTAQTRRRGALGAHAFVVMLAALAMMSWNVAAAQAAGGNGLTPTVATTDQLLAAEELGKGELAGLSEEQPNICTGVDINRDLDPYPATDRSGLGVFPAQVEIGELRPGDTWRSCAVVVNTSDEEVALDLTTVELIGSPNPDVEIELQLDPVSMGKWIHPLVTSITVPANESVEIPYLITVPDVVPAGTVTGGLRITTAANTDAATSFANSVVHRVYGTFPGAQRKRLEITEIEAPRVLSRSDGDLAYRVKYVVTNNGAVVDVFTSSLKVTGLGRTVGEAEIGPTVLLPNGAAREELVWRKLPWIGWYSPKVTVQTREGAIDVPVPRLLILPPAPYLIALIVAALLPIAWFVFAMRRRRRAWQEYYDEPDEHDDELLDHEYDH